MTVRARPQKVSSFSDWSGRIYRNFLHESGVLLESYSPGHALQQAAETLRFCYSFFSSSEHHRPARTDENFWDQRRTSSEYRARPSRLDSPGGRDKAVFFPRPCEAKDIPRSLPIAPCNVFEAAYSCKESAERLETSLLSRVFQDHQRLSRSCAQRQGSIVGDY